ncbi:MAG: hypothetical protein ABI560_09995 [Myxococcales bacterium]
MLVPTAPGPIDWRPVMRATFALGGDKGTQSDPALEPSEVGGHTLLQRRLALYGKFLVLQSILYWLIYAMVWGPTVGFRRSLGHIVSWEVVLLTVIYSLTFFCTTFHRTCLWTEKVGNYSA